MTALILGGVDTGWTFYTPYSSTFSNTNVVVAICGIFIAGFSSIFTGLNFIVTVHKMHCPGMTWFRLPMFIWTIYATSIIFVLATPVLAITLTLVALERILGVGVFDPALGGDPILFQHLFWFYSHPAVYIMILPGMGVVSELVPAFRANSFSATRSSRWRRWQSPSLGFLVWDITCLSRASPSTAEWFSPPFSFLVAIPSGVKVFNWTATLYKGSISLETPMLYALGFIGLFTIGGLTGSFPGHAQDDMHVHDTYFVIAHFHYIMVGGEP